MNPTDSASIAPDTILTPPPADLLTLGGKVFFKNAIVYRLPPEFGLSAAELEAKLNAQCLLPCGTLEMERSGWVNSSALARTVHAVNGVYFIALGHHKKILPASMIRQEVERRAAELAEEQGAPIGRKQKRELKDVVTAELMAKAMVRTSASRALLDLRHGWLVVEAAGTARAEKLVAALRDTLGTLAVTLLDPQQSPSATMAAWLRTDEATHRLTIDTDLELQSEDEATVRYSRHALDREDIKQHLDEGKTVLRLGLTWNERVSFILTHQLEIKKIAFLTLSKDADGEGSATSAEEQLDADLILLSDDLSQMLGDLAPALGASLEASAADGG